MADKITSKHLKIEVVKIKGHKGLFVRISEQTDRAMFSGGVRAVGEDGRRFLASNDFWLESSSCPEAEDRGLYVRGSNENLDNELARVPDRKGWLNDLKVAVKEYNSKMVNLPVPEVVETIE